MKGRALLMIPGPIEFEPEVLQALGAPTTSHVAPVFIDAFGRALERLREVWQCPSGQPFVVAGSGTLAMELAGANLIEPGDRALVVSTGVFGDRFEDLLSRHGARVTVLRAPVGEIVSAADIDAELGRERYKLVTVTHVDTSTGVRMDVSRLGEISHRHGTLAVVDGVCSVGGEELRQELWQLDVVLTASQKAIGVPPGLALLVASPRALEAFGARRRPVGSYYADWTKWLPVMKAYESRTAGYFGTPAVNLVAALDVSLGQIVSEGMETRWARHALLARAFQAGVDSLGLMQVPSKPAQRAHTLSACYAPENIEVPALLQEVQSAGVTVAGGLHPEIRTRTFRVGHMGAVRAADVLATLGALETGLRRVGHRFDVGVGVAAAQRALVS
ncbi:MAG: alanine--glyoxylate aminotransferase family protein [Candidatus Bipolaricaulis sp.]|nr:alanine--glyoxylate aminotransferase family protein [Candidatus Bipolaricaulis sp.]